MSYSVLNRITDGGLGAEPPAATGVWRQTPYRWAIFVRFWKKSYFNPIGSHFVRVHSHLKELNF